MSQAEERFFETRIKVRFNEVDSYGVAWHGNYVAWLEVARNELAAAFDVGSPSLSAAGYFLPVISLRVDYKRPAREGDWIVVRSRLRQPRGALFVFDYRVMNEADGLLLVRAETHQVVLNRDRDLLVTLPAILRDAGDRIRRFHEGSDDGSVQPGAL